MSLKQLFFRSRAFGSCLIAGILISIVVAVGVYESDDERVHREFESTIDEYAFAINEAVAENVAILHSLRSFFNSSHEVERSEFKTFAHEVLSCYPSMRAVGWIPRVPTNEREHIEQQARDDGHKEFQITERQEQGIMVRAAESEEYYPVYYIEPLEGNQAALGFDLASNMKRRKALHGARDTGEAHATGRIQLVQEPEESWAELFFVPVYNGRPTNPDERKSMIRGLISGVFRIKDLLIASGPYKPADGMINLTLWGETVDGSTEFLHGSEIDGDELFAEYRYEAAIPLGGHRQWKLVATPGKEYISSQRSSAPAASLLIGIIITLLLAFYIDRLLREKERVELQVAIRTKALNAQSEALSESNEHLKQEIAERKRLQKHYADLTDHEQRRLGQELHDSLGQQIAVAAMLTKQLKDRQTQAAAVELQHLELLNKSIFSAQSQIRALYKRIASRGGGSCRPERCAGRTGCQCECHE